MPDNIIQLRSIENIYYLISYSKMIYFYVMVIIVLLFTSHIKLKINYSWKDILQKILKPNLRSLLFIVFFTSSYITSIHFNFISDSMKKAFVEDGAVMRGSIHMLIASLACTTTTLLYYIIALIDIILSESTGVKQREISGKS